MTRKMKCDSCQKTTLHILQREVKFTTKWRTLTKRGWECSKCETVKKTRYEVKNKNVQIWD